MGILSKDTTIEKWIVPHLSIGRIDAFKALLIRFEFFGRNWKALHYMAFTVIFIRKIGKKLKV